MLPNSDQNSESKQIRGSAPACHFLWKLSENQWRHGGQGRVGSGVETLEHQLRVPGEELHYQLLNVLVASRGLIRNAVIVFHVEIFNYLITYVRLAMSHSKSYKNI